MTDDAGHAPAAESAPAGAGEDGARRRRDPRVAAALLAVLSGIAVLVTGFVIVAIVSGGRDDGVSVEWYVAVACTTAVVFGPFALLAALGGQGLLRRRQWAPLLLLLGGTLVAGTGLAIVALGVSHATTPAGDETAPLGWLFDQVDDPEVWLLVAFAVVLTVIGALESASGVMGRGAATRRTGRTAPTAAAR